MSNFALIQQGSFTSDGLNKILNLRSDVDYVEVFNSSAAAVDTDTQNVDLAYEHWFNRGMTSGAGFKHTKLNATGNPVTVGAITAPNGFQLIDSTADALGAINNATSGTDLSAISTAAIPVASNNGTSGLVAGDVVRLYSTTGAPQLGGMDFTVGYNTLTSGTFSLDYMAQLAVAGTAGNWRKINFDPIFYPRHRYITKVTSSGSSAVVTTSVAHGYKRGQIVYFAVPAAFGMSELNGLQGTITAVTTQAVDSTNTFTVDIDVSSFDSFAFPAAAAFPFSPAIVNVKGEDSPYAYANSLDPLADSTVNLGYLGVLLGGATSSATQYVNSGPAGHFYTTTSVGDVMYWYAWKAYTVDNE